MLSNKIGFGWGGIGVAVLALGCMTHSVSAEAQCSTDAWSSTTGTVQAIGENTPTTGKKYEQSCGLTVSAGTPGYVTTTAPTDEDFFSTRFYAYTGELDLGNGSVDIFTARDGGENRATLSVRASNANAVQTQELVLTYSNGTQDVVHSEVVPIYPVWQAFTVTWEAGAGSGSISVKVDGRQVMTVSGINNGDEEVNEMDLGLVAVDSATGTAVFDAFETRRALPEPGLLGINELRNISTRAVVGTGRLVVPAGFAIAGDTPKCVLIRARGQSINLQGRDLVENPTLNLVRLGTNPPTQIEFNNDWGNHPLADEIDRNTAANLDPSDAAMITCLEPGNYTATLEGAAGTGLGIGIIEVNDIDRGTPYMLNISTRANAGVNFEKIVAGFIVDGPEQRNVLIKGRGQSIPLNITKLDDPRLQLNQLPGGAIANNEDWVDASNQADITATGRAPNDPSDSAILVSLDGAGTSFTVDLDSENGQSGVGIVEVIDIGGASIEAN